MATFHHQRGAYLVSKECGGNADWLAGVECCLERCGVVRNAVSNRSELLGGYHDSSLSSFSNHESKNAIAKNSPGTIANIKNVAR